LTRRPAMASRSVSYVPDDGAEHRVPLAQAWAVPLEQGMPVRRFMSRKGQRHLSGLARPPCDHPGTRNPCPHSDLGIR
jgi:hypothetical protein